MDKAKELRAHSFAPAIEPPVVSHTISNADVAPAEYLALEKAIEVWNDRVLSALEKKLALEAEIEEAQAQLAKWEAIKEQRLAAQAWIDAEVKKRLAKAKDGRAANQAWIDTQEEEKKEE